MMIDDRAPARRPRVAWIYPTTGLLDGMLHAMASGRGADLFIFRIARKPPGDSPHGDTAVLHGLASLSDVSGAEDLAAATGAVNPDVVAYACTAASFLGGLEHEGVLRTSVSSAAGLPATTTSGALLWALERMRADSVVVASPYVQEVGVRFEEFLSAAGVSVLSARHAGHGSNEAKVAMSAADVIDLLPDQSVLAEAQAIVIPCTGMPSEALSAAVEAHAGLPVVTANAATLDHALWLASAPA